MPTNLSLVAHVPLLRKPHSPITYGVLPALIQENVNADSTSKCPTGMPWPTRGNLRHGTSALSPYLGIELPYSLFLGSPSAGQFALPLKRSD